MARLDPHAFPDRFALERYARRMRSDEAARVAGAAIRGLRAFAQSLAERIRGTPVGPARRPTHTSA